MNSFVRPVGVSFVVVVVVSSSLCKCGISMWITDNGHVFFSEMRERMRPSIPRRNAIETMLQCICLILRSLLRIDGKEYYLLRTIEGN